MKNDTEGFLMGWRKHWLKDMRWNDILEEIFNEILHTDVLAKMHLNSFSENQILNFECFVSRSS